MGFSAGLAFAGFGAGGAQAETRVLVADFESRPGLSNLAAQIRDEVLLTVDSAPEFQAVSSAELALLLRHEEDQSSLAECDEDRRECLAKIEAAAQAQGYLSGRVALWGQSRVVTLAYNHDGSIERDSCMAVARPELLACVRTTIRRLLHLEQVPESTISIAQGPTKIAVLDLEAHSDELKDTSKDLTQLFALELKRFEGVSVISRAEIEVMLDYALTRAECTGDDDLSCLVEIGGALGVDYLAHGAIGHLGDTYVIHLKLLDIHNAAVKSRVSEQFAGELSELRRAIRFATTALMGQELSGQGQIGIEGAPEQSQVSVDGRPLDLSKARALLTVGKHHIRIEADGYHTQTLDLYIEPDRLTTMQAKLQAKTPRWYKRWWTWAIAGTVIAAAGVTSAALLSSAGPTQGRIDVEVP